MFEVVKFPVPSMYTFEVGEPIVIVLPKILALESTTVVRAASLLPMENPATELNCLIVEVIGIFNSL